MAKVRKTADGRSKSVKVKVGKIKVVLPTEPSEVSHDLNDYHFLIHGEPKIGKTTFAMQEENVLLLTFDPDAKSLHVMRKHLPDWPHFKAYLLALEKAARKKNFPYRRVVLDGADLWYRHCQKWVCTKLAIDHPSEEAWGKGWDQLREEFTSALDRLMALPCGTWFVCHSKWKEVETRRAGSKIEKLVPDLKGAAEEILVGKADGSLAYLWDEKDRVLVVRGDERTGAGHRVDGHFQTPGGKLVKEIVMGDDGPAEAYRRFKRAFDNKQTYTTLARYRKRQRLAKKGVKKKA